MKSNPEYQRFQDGIRKILKANPAVVKAAMEQERQERASGGKAKRGPKPKTK